MHHDRPHSDVCYAIRWWITHVSCIVPWYQVCILKCALLLSLPVFFCQVGYVLVLVYLSAFLSAKFPKQIRQIFAKFSIGFVLGTRKIRSIFRVIWIWFQLWELVITISDIAEVPQMLILQYHPVISSCLAISSAVMVGELFLWPALRYGTGYQTVWEIRPSAETSSSVHWKRFYFQLTHVHSALELFGRCALQIYLLTYLLKA